MGHMSVLAAEGLAEWPVLPLVSFLCIRPHHLLPVVSGVMKSGTIHRLRAVGLSTYILEARSVDTVFEKDAPGIVASKSTKAACLVAEHFMSTPNSHCCVCLGVSQSVSRHECVWQENT